MTETKPTPIEFVRDGERCWVCLTQQDTNGRWTHPVLATPADLTAALKSLPEAQRTMVIIDCLEDSSALGQAREELAEAEALLLYTQGHVIELESKLASAEARCENLAMAASVPTAEFEALREMESALRASAKPGTMAHIILVEFFDELDAVRGGKATSLAAPTRDQYRARVLELEAKLARSNATANAILPVVTAAHSFAELKQRHDSERFDLGRITMAGDVHRAEQRLCDEVFALFDGARLDAAKDPSSASASAESTARKVSWCPECGFGAMCDEDGCCTSCGGSVGLVPDWRLLEKQHAALMSFFDFCYRELSYPTRELRAATEREMQRVAQALGKLTAYFPDAKAPSPAAPTREDENSKEEASADQAPGPTEQSSPVEPECAPPGSRWCAAADRTLLLTVRAVEGDDITVFYDHGPGGVVTREKFFASFRPYRDSSTCFMCGSPTPEPMVCDKPACQAHFHTTECRCNDCRDGVTRHPLSVHFGSGHVVTLAKLLGALERVIEVTYGPTSAALVALRDALRVGPALTKRER